MTYEKGNNFHHEAFVQCRKQKHYKTPFLLLVENFIRKNFLAREKLLFFIKKFFIKQIWTKLVKTKNQKHETLIPTKDSIKNTKT